MHYIKTIKMKKQINYIKYKSIHLFSNTQDEINFQVVNEIEENCGKSFIEEILENLNNNSKNVDNEEDKINSTFQPEINSNILGKKTKRFKDKVELAKNNSNKKYSNQTPLVFLGNVIKEESKSNKDEYIQKKEEDF